MRLHTLFHQEFDCVIIVGSVRKLTGLWKVEDCGAKRGFICKRNVGKEPGGRSSDLGPRSTFWF